jgi:hypothetical protein
MSGREAMFNRLAASNAALNRACDSMAETIEYYERRLSEAGAAVPVVIGDPDPESTSTPWWTRSTSRSSTTDPNRPTSMFALNAGKALDNLVAISVITRRKDYYSRR